MAPIGNGPSTLNVPGKSGVSPYSFFLLKVVFPYPICTSDFTLMRVSPSTRLNKDSIYRFLNRSLRTLVRLVYLNSTLKLKNLSGVT